MRNLISLVFIMSIVMSAGLAQSEPTPQPIRSVFDYDTCAPPCWMGLVAGESTFTDVKYALRTIDDPILRETLDIVISRLPSGEDDINPYTGEIQTGAFLFDINTISYIDEGIRSPSRIEIGDGRVDIMVINAHQPIILDDVLINLGEPDFFRLCICSADWTYITLIYIELNLRVSFRHSTDVCRTSLLPHELLMKSLLYYSPELASNIVGSTLSEYDIPQPNLTRYSFLNERDVPLDVWQSWLDGEVDMSCEEFWTELPIPEITPAVEITSEPNVIPTSTQEGK
jgi:hypothetical protein